MSQSWFLIFAIPPNQQALILTNGSMSRAKYHHFYPGVVIGNFLLRGQDNLSGKIYLVATLTETRGRFVSQRSKTNRIGRIGLAVALTAIIVIGTLWYIGVFGGNIHDIVPGRVYRSAQLTGSNLDAVLAQDHIQSEINLRGGSMKNAFYRSEISECKAYGVVHYDVPMSARKLPTPAQLDSLLTIFDTAKYPILFHCQAGADRTGLVATLYMNVYQHVPLDQAESAELTFRYGHVSFGQTHAMNDFFTLYRQTCAGMDLRTWIMKKYPLVYSYQRHI